MQGRRGEAWQGTLVWVGVGSGRLRAGRLRELDVTSLASSLAAAAVTQRLSIKICREGGGTAAAA